MDKQVERFFPFLVWLQEWVNVFVNWLSDAWRSNLADLFGD